MSQGVQDDIKTMQPSVDAIVKRCETLRTDADATFGARLNSEVEEMRGRWKRVIDLSGQHNVRLKDSVATTQNLIDDLHAMETWIDAVVRNDLAHEYTVHSKQELIDLKDKFQV